jgi:hypothetical protein
MKLAVPAFIKNQPVRFFALVCVAILSAFVMVMRYRELQVLASPDWCNRVLKADQIAPASRMDAALACVGMQKLQIEAYATNSFIDGGTIALCLVALMVIVVASGHLSFASKLGSINVGRDKVDPAQFVADEAQDAADQVKTGTVVPKAADAGLPPGIK